MFEFIPYHFLQGFAYLVIEYLIEYIHLISVAILPNPNIREALLYIVLKSLKIMYRCNNPLLYS